MMASTITTIPTKTSVERKPRAGYRFTIDIGTLNALYFDLTESEFHELFKQMEQVSVVTIGGRPSEPIRTHVVRAFLPGDGYMVTLGGHAFRLTDDEFGEFVEQIAAVPMPGPINMRKVREAIKDTAEAMMYQGNEINAIEDDDRFARLQEFKEALEQRQAQSAPTTDTTNHPDYYGWHPVAECIEISQHFNGNLAQAIQYIWRCGRKPGVSAVKDLEKSIDFLRFEIDRIKRFEHRAKENPPV